ncbi:MAG: helical backbone metal receptor [Planctomycetia bacterium]|nr:helical backbone metal receptor [Planctomycetia bacterium]
MSQLTVNRMVPTRDVCAVVLLLLLLILTGALSGCRPGASEGPAEQTEPQASRIISTAPAITETVIALGEEKRLIAVSQFCAYLDEVRQLPKVGGLYNPNIEEMIRLNPDLIILDSGAVDLAARLHTLGIETLVMDTRSLQGIINAIVNIGRHCGPDAEARAKQVAETLYEHLQQVRARTSQGEKPSVLLVLDRPLHARTFSSFYAAGNNPLFNEIIEIAGGRNVLGESPFAVSGLSLESVIDLDPDYIFDLTTNDSISQMSQEEQEKLKPELLADWENFREQVRAVRSGHVYPLLEHYATVPGPNINLLVEAMAQVLHPENSPTE